MMKWGLWFARYLDYWEAGKRAAYEAYKEAITSEHNLGLNVVRFCH